MDVRIVFLNVEFEEKIYLKQLKYLAWKGCNQLVCKIHKLMYGRKQSSIYWYHRFYDMVVKWGFLILINVCTKRFRLKLVCITLYINDILIVRNNIEFLTQVKFDCIVYLR